MISWHVFALGKSTKKIGPSFALQSPAAVKVFRMVGSENGALIFAR